MNILSWIFDAKIRALVSARCNGNTVTGRGTGNDTLPQRDGAGGKITFHKTDFYIRSVAGTAYAELGADNMLFYKKFKENMGLVHWEDVTPEGLEKAEQFLNDVKVANQNFIDNLAINPELIKSWEAFLDEGYDALKINPDALKALDEAVAEGLDGMDAINDAIQTLNVNTWAEIQILFKRGNDFNRKARVNSWWPVHEVTIVHPTHVYPLGHNKAGQPKRYRLDSYDHNLGKRISRKATEFDAISEQTWLNYLNEIDNKYPEGAIIKRPGSVLNDQPLQGEKILEVPDSNIGSVNQQLFEQMATNNGVTVVYKPE